MTRPPVPYVHERAPGGRVVAVRMPRRVHDKETREALDELERAESVNVEPIEDARQSDVLERANDDAKRG